MVQLKRLIRKKIYEVRDFVSYKKRNEEISSVMYIIAGLGNPTKQYEKTRHNAGFDTIDAVADKYQIAMNETKYKAVCGRGMIAGQKVLLVKPQTFMNNSGESVGAFLRFYKLDPASQLLVIYDDISLEPGNIRIRLKGSAGGHNGIKSIIAHAGTQEFARIKIGVGQKPPERDLADYVLGHFSKDERAKVEEAMNNAVEAVELILSDDAGKAMNLYNKKKK